MLDRLRHPRPHLPRLAFLHSVFFRATMIVFLCTLLVTGVLTALNYQSSRAAAYAAAHERAAMFAEKLAGAVVNPMRFGAHDRVDEIIQQYFGDSDGQSLGILAFDSGGRDFAGLADGEVEPLLRDLLAQAKDSGKMAATEDGMDLVTPIRDTRDTLLGYIALAWSPEQALATLNGRLREALIITAGVFVLALLGAAIGFSRLIARPLVKVNQAVERVAAGDYTLDVPMRRRRDEIGAIAKALESFRASLSESAEISRQAMFNSAALEASSGAVLITDTGHRILHLNAAALQFFATHAEGFRDHDPAFDPGNLIGRRADQLIPSGGQAAQAIDQEDSDHVRVESQIGGRTIEVVVAPVHNAEGGKIGTVSQWSDISRDMRNITVIGAIDASQLRAEFRVDGQMTFANAHFSVLFDAAGVPRETTDMRAALRLADDGTPLFDWLAREESFNGKLRVSLGGEAFTLDAVVAPVRDRDGVVQHYMMLARDSTSAEAALAAAEERRATLEATQHAVVEALREGLALLSRGVLNTRIDAEFAPQYEQLRADYNVAAQNLRQAMERVVETARAIEREARELVSAGDDLNRRTEQQAATLEETAAALNEMTTSVKAAAALSAQANRMVEEAKSNAEASGSVVRDAVQAMGEIEDSSQKISKITSVIDDIAFQTNLLALNAGVEAARAGEAGRGFAVVASEVRALAQRSSEAAREIAGLISSSTAQIARGVGLVGEAGDALHGIETSVGEICHAISEITASSQDQAAGLSEINTALTQLDQVTQRNAAMFEQTNASSHALTRDAFNLLETIGLFDLGEVSSRRSVQDGDGDTEEASPPPRPVTPVADMRAPAPKTRGATQGALALEQEPDDWEDF